MITKEVFESFKEWEIFAKWVVENSPYQVFLTRDVWKLLKWVAVKWYANDWTMYFWWDIDNSYFDVSQHWDKSLDDYNIKRLCNCDDYVFKLYRD